MRDAVRPDLADARLADRIFAPHYVLPVVRVVSRSADLRVAREPDADVLLRVSSGDTFELLDVTGGGAWGIVRPSGIVGYLDATVLEGQKA